MFRFRITKQVLFERKRVHLLLRNGYNWLANVAKGRSLRRFADKAACEQRAQDSEKSESEVSFIASKQEATAVCARPAGGIKNKWIVHPRHQKCQIKISINRFWLTSEWRDNARRRRRHLKPTPIASDKPTSTSLRPPSRSLKSSPLRAAPNASFRTPIRNLFYLINPPLAFRHSGLAPESIPFNHSATIAEWTIIAGEANCKGGYCLSEASLPASVPSLADY